MSSSARGAFASVTAEVHAAVEHAKGAVPPDTPLLNVEREGLLFVISSDYETSLTRPSWFTVGRDCIVGYKTLDSNTPFINHWLSDICGVDRIASAPEGTTTLPGFPYPLSLKLGKNRQIILCSRSERDREEWHNILSTNTTRMTTLTSGSGHASELNEPANDPLLSIISEGEKMFGHIPMPTMSSPTLEEPNKVKPRGINEWEMKRDVPRYSDAPAPLVIDELSKSNTRPSSTSIPSIEKYNNQDSNQKNSNSSNTSDSNLTNVTKPRASLSAPVATSSSKKASPNKLSDINGISSKILTPTALRTNAKSSSRLPPASPLAEAVKFSPVAPIRRDSGEVTNLRKFRKQSILSEEKLVTPTPKVKSSNKRPSDPATEMDSMTVAELEGGDEPQRRKFIPIPLLKSKNNSQQVKGNSSYTPSANSDSINTNNRKEDALSERLSSDAVSFLSSLLTATKIRAEAELLDELRAQLPPGDATALSALDELLADASNTDGALGSVVIGGKGIVVDGSSFHNLNEPVSGSDRSSWSTESDLNKLHLNFIDKEGYQAALRSALDGTRPFYDLSVAEGGTNLNNNNNTNNNQNNQTVNRRGSDMSNVNVNSRMVADGNSGERGADPIAETTMCEPVDVLLPDAEVKIRILSAFEIDIKRVFNACVRGSAAAAAMSAGADSKSNMYSKPIDDATIMQVHTVSMDDFVKAARSDPMMLGFLSVEVPGIRPPPSHFERYGDILDAYSTHRRVSSWYQLQQVFRSGGAGVGPIMGTSGSHKLSKDIAKSRAEIVDEWIEGFGVEDHEKLRCLFQYYDIDQDGCISVDELKLLMQEVSLFTDDVSYAVSYEDVLHIMRNIDVDNDLQCSFNELCRGLRWWRRTKQDQRNSGVTESKSSYALKNIKSNITSGGRYDRVVSDGSHRSHAHRRLSECYDGASDRKIIRGFESASVVSPVTSHDRDLKFMFQAQGMARILREGARFLKYRKKSPPHLVQVWVSDTFEWLLWKRTKDAEPEGHQCLKVSDLRTVRRGEAGRVLEPGMHGKPQATILIVGVWKTLKLGCKSVSEAQRWLAVLSFLIENHGALVALAHHGEALDVCRPMAPESPRNPDNTTRCQLKKISSELKHAEDSFALERNGYVAPMTRRMVMDVPPGSVPRTHWSSQ